MQKNLEDEFVRRKVGEIPKSSPEELARMRAIQDGPIDTSDIPERTRRRRLKRDKDGRLLKRRNPIRETVAAAMAERGMTTYSLWKVAKDHSPTISETAIGEFLKGRRSIGVEYIEALLDALGLTILDHSGGDRLAGTSPSHDRPYTESKVEGTVQFLVDDPSRPPSKPATPIGVPHPAIIHLVEFRFDPDTVHWFGAADVACDILEVTCDATAAGMSPIPSGCTRDLGEYLMQVRLPDGRLGLAHNRTSFGEYNDDPAGQYHRLDFIGLSLLGT